MESFFFFSLSSSSFFLSSLMRWSLLSFSMARADANSSSSLLSWSLAWSLSWSLAWLLAGCGTVVGILSTSKVSLLAELVVMLCLMLSCKSSLTLVWKFEILLYLLGSGSGVFFLSLMVSSLCTHSTGVFFFIPKRGIFFIPH